MSRFTEVFSERKGQLLSALLEHIQISFIALFFAVLIAIPLGIYLTRKPRVAEPIIGVTGVFANDTVLGASRIAHPVIRHRHTSCNHCTGCVCTASRTPQHVHRHIRS